VELHWDKTSIRAESQERVFHLTKAETVVIIMSLTVFWHSSQENSMRTLQDSFLKRLEAEIIPPYMVNVSHLHFVLRIFKTNSTTENKYILIPLCSSPKHIEVAKLQSTKSKL